MFENLDENNIRRNMSPFKIKIEGDQNFYDRICFMPGNIQGARGIYLRAEDVQIWSQFQRSGALQSVTY